MIIKRDFYLNKLIQREQNGLIKVVTGVRRCGKSFLLSVLFKNHLMQNGVPAQNIIEIPLDDRKNKDLRNPDACYNYVCDHMGKGQHYLLIDEVQMMREFEDVLNGFLHISNLDVYVTGSNSRFLSTDVITEFRGRGDEVRLHPLSFAEYHSACGGDWDDNYNEYMIFGGMPYLVSLESDTEKIAYLNRLFDETYLRDIVERNRISNEGALADLIDIIASSTGSLINPNRIENTFKSAGEKAEISAPTINAYLKYLEDAFLVSKAKRYDVKGRKHIGTPCKYYFEDVGLRNSRLNFRQNEPGHIMENIIYNELLRRGYAVDVGVVQTTDAGKRKRVEIDFVANLGKTRYYIQSAFALPDEAKYAQEQRSLRSVNDSFKKIIIVGGSLKPTIDDAGIVTMGLKQFLLDDDSLSVC